MRWPLFPWIPANTGENEPNYSYFFSNFCLTKNFVKFYVNKKYRGATAKQMCFWGGTGERTYNFGGNPEDNFHQA